MISASGCVINSGARGSTMQAASRSATRSRCSTSRKTKMPASDDSRPPSNLATTVLPPTGDRPGSDNIELVMAGMASRKWRGLELITKSYAKSVICAISANLRCIIRVSFYDLMLDQCQPNDAIARYVQPVYVPNLVTTCIHYGLRQPLRIRKAQFHGCREFALNGTRLIFATFADATDADPATRHHRCS